MDFSLLGRGRHSPAPKKVDGVRCCGKGASLSRAQWEQTRAACGCTMKRERNNNSNCGEGAFSVRQRARDGVTQQ
jgi:hypothetical protein